MEKNQPLYNFGTNFDIAWNKIKFLSPWAKKLCFPLLLACSWKSLDYSSTNSRPSSPHPCSSTSTTAFPRFFLAPPGLPECAWGILPFSSYKRNEPTIKKILRDLLHYTIALEGLCTLPLVNYLVYGIFLAHILSIVPISSVMIQVKLSYKNY